MRFSVVIPMIFHHLPLAEGLKRANEANMKHVEIMKWYDENLNELKQILDKFKMQVVMLSAKSFQLVDTGQHERFIDGLHEAIAAAKYLNCRNLITLVGNELPHLSREQQRQNIVEALKKGAKLLESAEITLHIEPLNIRVDHPKYFLYSSDEAVEIIKKVGSPRVKLLFDLYHQQVSEGDLIRRITQHLPYIGHFHVAGNPGRTEILDGEINYLNIFHALNKLNYQGYVGLEYIPSQDPVTSLQTVRACFQSIIK